MCGASGKGWGGVRRLGLSSAGGSAGLQRVRMSNCCRPSLRLGVPLPPPPRQPRRAPAVSLSNRRARRDERNVFLSSL